MRDALATATLYRLAALLVEPPRPGLGRDIAALADSLPEPLAEQARALADLDAAAEEYHRLLGASGTCRDCESDWDGATLAGKGQQLADVAGFFRAFRFEPAGLGPPDHISHELGFLGYLALKRAYAEHRGAHEEARLCSEAAAAFLRDHAGAFAPAFFARLEETAGDGAYARAARLGSAALHAAMATPSP